MRGRPRAAILEQPGHDVEAADNNDDHGRGDGKGAQALGEFLWLRRASRAGPGPRFVLRCADGGDFRGAARGGDEIGLAATRIGNDGRLRPDRRFRRGDAVGC